MLGFATHCHTCGIDIEKENGVKRFGKYFCSNEHAAQYGEIRIRNEVRKDDDSDSSRRSGGCCG